MVYTKPLPRIDNILWLSKLAMPFPASSAEIAEIARSWRFDKRTLDFLTLFPADEVFKTRQDFLTRSEELELLLREERKMPVEPALSPQD